MVGSRAEAGNVKVSLEHNEPKSKEAQRLQVDVRRHKVSLKECPLDN